MVNEKTSEKEFAIIKAISGNPDIHQDQRIIAKNTGISLGMTNLIMKRLIKKGYIKALQLNRRKIRYILTPKGFSEKAKKSCRYTIKTINLFGLIKGKIQELIERESATGRKEFLIAGDGELADIIEFAFQSVNSSELKYSRVNYIKESMLDDSRLVFLSRQNNYASLRNKDNTKNVVDMVNYLAESGICL
jgi:DNA-binding MarR family transcriptional regulator